MSLTADYKDKTGTSTKRTHGQSPQINQKQKPWLTTPSLSGRLFRDKYRGADTSVAQLNSHCILFDGENISFDASVVICINSTNIPSIMIIK